MASPLSLLHFNDVYRVTPQKINPAKPTETIDVTQFAALIDDLRDRWPQRPDGNRDGLLLFSGDVFSPSVESSVTRGSHMVPVLNELGVDVTVTGNHDFDFGYPHLTKLIHDTKFPWILSNIIDTTTSRTPEGLHEYAVVERAGVRIGFIGLVEQEWITTVSSWPSTFMYQSMKETGIKLSKLLRDSNGEHRCDIIIALTHSRLPNDITLAKELLALSPSAQQSAPIAAEHGVDIILGGHDHIYYAGPGVTSWENFDFTRPTLGAESDNGEVLVIKSGSDFRELSEITLTLTSTSEGSVRRKVISEIKGKRHVTQPGSRSSEPMVKILKAVLSSVSSALKAPLCKSTVKIDVRSSYIRTTESPVANWISDIARHAYDDALCMKGLNGCRGSDGVLFCAGTFRGDSTYGPGLVTIGDILEILPFEDPALVLEVDGAMLWDAIESSLKTWPAQEGRFPAVSGFRVSWDSRKEPGNRVLGIWLLVSENSHIIEEPVKRESGGKTYTIVTREYMAEGHDGFEALTRGKVLIDHECGALISTIVRQYLLGSQFVNKIVRLQTEQKRHFINEHTREIIAALQRDAEHEKHPSPVASAINLWRHAADIIQKAQSQLHYRNHFKISHIENMSSVDAFDGEKVRQGQGCAELSTEENADILIITPAIDGRLKNEGAGDQ
ncbi:flagellar associated protein [Pholiota conissans]|uniref:Flagellar associated protein n=1 Tax=Pholiota conissans TaxID=109636 RepID=A0A9P5YP36_9AGAR|nr:flagellar associated protein [Pholiota conissans]